MTASQGDLSNLGHLGTDHATGKLRRVASRNIFRGVERARDWPAATAAGVPSQAQPGRAVRAAGHLGRAS